MTESIKEVCWAKYIGDTIGSTKCLCCKSNKIKMTNFSIGFRKSIINGGIMEVDNILPICVACKSSMGNMDMSDFCMANGFSVPSSNKSVASQIVGSIYNVWPIRLFIQ